MFRNKQEFKADITIAKIPDITAEELEKAIREDEEETEEFEEVTEIVDEPEISEEITENAEEIEETTEKIEEVIEETVEEEKEEIKEEVVEEKPTKKGFFAKLFAGLDKTRKNILGGVDAVLGAFTKIDEELFEELEEVLIMADIGVETTMNIIDNLRKRVKKEKTTDPQEIKGMLVDEITELLNEGADDDYDLPKPTVMLVIGVNGVGKTTTIGKLSHNYKEQGDKVLLAAADTFRAAAIDQLKIWGERAGIDVIRHEENSDPAAVVFDAVNAAKNRGTDILICDTAGRLHNKKNLMEELKKISKVIDREYPQANKEVYLVLDATTGQNAMQQAKLFKEVADITGIILTKLDGTAKGGIVIAIKSELNIPVRYIGVGEGINDLQKFNARDFASALFGNE
ncbi:MAG TPA: signal recognition particle-docking protein FtsY [Candidatus Fimicola cottocaccae]|nr:signal recognition particle-docking protein FtsY [Candidatus Fimicola cottocaccae]